MKIILDTNVFLVPGKFKVDVFEEFDRIVDKDYELITIEPVVRELKKISQGNGKDAKSARIGLKFIKSKNIKVLKTKEKYTDKAILGLSKSFLEKGKKCAVATLDKELKQELIRQGSEVIYLRNKKYLVLK